MGPRLFRRGTAGQSWLAWLFRRGMAGQTWLAWLFRRGTAGQSWLAWLFRRGTAGQTAGRPAAVNAARTWAIWPAAGGVTSAQG
jgi:hypothetical protein